MVFRLLVRRATRGACAGRRRRPSGAGASASANATRPGGAVVKTVAAMHGGHVHATSEGGITTIGFSVPIGRAEEDARDGDPQAADARLVTG